MRNIARYANRSVYFPPRVTVGKQMLPFSLNQIPLLKKIGFFVNKVFVNNFLYRKHIYRFIIPLAYSKYMENLSLLYWFELEMT